MKIAGIVALCAVVVGVVAFVVISRHTMVLERRFVMQFKVVELTQDGARVVRISGLSGHSALSVKDISARRVDSSIDVIVCLFLARRGTTGYFQYDVPVPDGVNQIRFGRGQVVIWSR